MFIVGSIGCGFGCDILNGKINCNLLPFHFVRNCCLQRLNKIKSYYKGGIGDGVGGNAGISNSFVFKLKMCN